jgi:hypothetical protein
MANSFSESLNANINNNNHHHNSNYNNNNCNMQVKNNKESMYNSDTFINNSDNLNNHIDHQDDDNEDDSDSETKVNPFAPSLLNPINSFEQRRWAHTFLLRNDGTPILSHWKSEKTHGELEATSTVQSTSINNNNNKMRPGKLFLI